jgi:hypothetical protein
MKCPECGTSMLAQHRVGCAWYAERLLESLAEAIEDDIQLCVVPRSAPPPGRDSLKPKKHA